jgi:arabinogalactan oligomer/maltooligosaccharide transport system permease protein
LKQLPANSWTLDTDGNLQSVEGYTFLTDDEIALVLEQYSNYFVPGLQENVKYRVADFTNVERITPTLRYDAAGDFVENLLTGEIYKPNSEGSFVGADGTELEPGWTARIGLKNLERVIGDERYRTPLVKVLIWTFVYPFLVVIITFFLGLFLALTINHPKIKPKKLYRILLIVPYAMPGVLSILTWKGMLNESYGIVNKLLPGAVPWLSDPWWAKVAVVLVQVWAGTPYMFLIATGAIQALSTEIVEASEVDGASPRQVFWNIKLPLVVIALTPLLIASYAYNFSNFGSIYLLTGGGPVMYDSGGVAGYTDILISYTYNLAFTAGKGRDYGLASAVSFINFLIVAVISIQAFRRSKQMENIN